MTTTRLLIAVSISTWLGCALFRPDPNLPPEKRARNRIEDCVRDQLWEARCHPRVLFTHCWEQIDAYCAALGQQSNCLEGRQVYQYEVNGLSPPPNVNHVGPP